MRSIKRCLRNRRKTTTNKVLYSQQQGLYTCNCVKSIPSHHDYSFFVRKCLPTLSWMRASSARYQRKCTHSLHALRSGTRVKYTNHQHTKPFLHRIKKHNEHCASRDANRTSTTHYRSHARSFCLHRSHALSWHDSRGQRFPVKTKKQPVSLRKTGNERIRFINDVPIAGHKN